MSIHMHIIQRHHLAQVTGVSQVMVAIHLVMGIGPSNWRLLEVSVGVSYDANGSRRLRWLCRMIGEPAARRVDPSVDFGLKSGNKTMGLGLTLSTSMGGRSRSTNLASEPSNSSNVLNASTLTSFPRSRTTQDGLTLYKCPIWQHRHNNVN